jgi:hypothetical protein
VTALVEAAAERRALTRTLYSLWRDIEECRDESHYCSTTAALQAAEQLTTVAGGNTTAPGANSSDSILGVYVYQQAIHCRCAGSSSSL